MEISSLNSFRLTPERQKALDPAVSESFQQQLQMVQGSTDRAASSSLGAKAAAAPASRASIALLSARYNHNGEDVGFEELPADVQKWFREVDEKNTRDNEYRARVANDPNIGPVAKLRPFDPELDGWAMKRLAAMEPSTAHMSPEEYYNYMGSDPEKYDTLIHKAESPDYEAGSRIFGVDLEEESKVALIRDLKVEGRPLPETFAQFEQSWLSDFVRQQALAQEREQLLGNVRPLEG